MTSEPWILGYSASHNGAVCLLRGSRIVVAIQEERLTRQKRANLSSLEDSCALRYCLDYAGITLSDITAIAGSGPLSAWAAPDITGFKGFVWSVPHHAAHAYAVFATSGFTNAIVLVIDGRGNELPLLKERFPDELVNVKYATLPESSSPVVLSEIMSVYYAEDRQLVPLEKHIGIPEFPLKSCELFPLEQRMSGFGSLGGMFNIAGHKIFGQDLEAGKVMGLAPYGRVTFPASHILEIAADGSLVFKEELSLEGSLYAGVWPKHEETYADLACSVQHAFEEALDIIVERCAAYGKNQVRHLCYAGGVSLNSVANEKLVARRLFDAHYLMPAAEDSGVAIGAAYYALWKLGHRNARTRLTRDSLGRRYSRHEVLRDIGAVPHLIAEEPHDLNQRSVDLLCRGKILGWFKDGSELGSRALGQRSILIDPRLKDSKAVLNERVKHREGFRPFAPVILEEQLHEWFDIVDEEPDYPFMLRVCRFKDHAKERVPAVVHVDQTGRVQTVNATHGALYPLLAEFFARTGVPMLLNTSFNVMGEPIVETPEDAMWCMLFSGIDAAVVEHMLVSKEAGFRSILADRPCALRQHASLSAHLDWCGVTLYWINCSKRWGSGACAVNVDAYAVLERCNGVLSGYELIDVLNRSTPAAPVWTEIRMLRALAQLHRADCIAFEYSDCAVPQAHESSVRR